MVELIENEASTAQDQLWERSRRREVRLSFRQLAARSDKRWKDERWEKDGKRDGRRSCQNLKPGSPPARMKLWSELLGA